jgi:hypothetical protein
MESGTRTVSPPTDLLTYAITAARAGFDYFVGLFAGDLKENENFFHPAVQLLLWLYRVQ